MRGVLYISKFDNEWFYYIMADLIQIESVYGYSNSIALREGRKTAKRLGINIFKELNDGK